MYTYYLGYRSVLLNSLPVFREVSSPSVAPPPTLSVSHPNLPSLLSSDASVAPCNSTAEAKRSRLRRALRELSISLAFGCSRMCQPLHTAQDFTMPLLLPGIPISPFPCQMVFPAFKTDLKAEMCLTPFLSNFSLFRAGGHLCAQLPVHLVSTHGAVRRVSSSLVDCELPESRFSLSPVPSTMPGPTGCLIRRCGLKD